MRQLGYFIQNLLIFQRQRLGAIQDNHGQVSIGDGAQGALDPQGSQHGLP